VPTSTSASDVQLTPALSLYSKWYLVESTPPLGLTDPLNLALVAVISEAGAIVARGGVTAPSTKTRWSTVER
jgi:hypothetical protein